MQHRRHVPLMHLNFPLQLLSIVLSHAVFTFISERSSCVYCWYNNVFITEFVTQVYNLIFVQYSKYNTGLFFWVRFSCLLLLGSFLPVFHIRYIVSKNIGVSSTPETSVLSVLSDFIGKNVMSSFIHTFGTI